MRTRLEAAKKELGELEKTLNKLYAKDSNLDKKQLELLRRLTARNQQDKELLTEILRTLYSIQVKEAEIEALGEIEAQ